MASKKTNCLVSVQLCLNHFKAVINESMLILLFPVGRITVRYLMILRIDFTLKIVFTSYFQFTFIGRPLLIAGPLGGFALQLNGIDQRFDLGDRTSECLGDITKCHLGVTFNFQIKVTSSPSRCVILNNGGDEDGSYGYAMWVSKKQLFLRITTLDKEWNVVTNKLTTNKYHKVTFSWGIQYGLHLFIDGSEVKASTDFITRTVVASRSVRKSFYFGQGSTGDFCAFDFYALSVVYAIKPLVDSEDIPLGKTHILPVCNLFLEQNH